MAEVTPILPAQRWCIVYQGRLMLIDAWPLSEADAKNYIARLDGAEVVLVTVAKADG